MANVTHATVLHRSGWGFAFAFLPYGDVWRESRKIIKFTRHFNPSNPSINQPRDIIYVRRFLGQLLQSPNDFLQHARTINVHPYNDPYIKLTQEAAEAVAELLIAGAFLVDIIPILKYVPEWFPGARFHRKAAIIREHAERIRNYPFAAAEKLMASGDYDPSFVTEALSEINYSNASDRDIDLLKDVATMAYIGGADTTASAIGTFFLAMVCYPDVQREAQAELDKVLEGRLPEHNDIASLPYFSALIKEVYRWQPVLPLGLPHQSTSDDLYNNYHIPAKSIVMANQWAMLNDERDYPEPLRNPMDIAFGFGRRVCPGQHIAHSTVTLLAASVLSTFDLLKKKWTGMVGKLNRRGNIKLHQYVNRFTSLA